MLRNDNDVKQYFLSHTSQEKLFKHINTATNNMAPQIIQQNLLRIMNDIYNSPNYRRHGNMSFQTHLKNISMVVINIVQQLINNGQQPPQHQQSQQSQQPQQTGLYSPLVFENDNLLGNGLNPFNNGGFQQPSQNNNNNAFNYPQLNDQQNNGGNNNLWSNHPEDNNTIGFALAHEQEERNYENNKQRGSPYDDPITRQNIEYLGKINISSYKRNNSIENLPPNDALKWLQLPTQKLLQIQHDKPNLFFRLIHTTQNMFKDIIHQDDDIKHEKSKKQKRKHKTKNKKIHYEPNTFNVSRKSKKHKPKSTILDLDFRSCLVDIRDYKFKLQFNRLHNVKHIELKSCVINNNESFDNEAYIYLQIDEFKKKKKHSVVKLFVEKTINGFTHMGTKDKNNIFQVKDGKVLDTFTVSFRKYNNEIISINKFNNIEHISRHKGALKISTKKPQFVSEGDPLNLNIIHSDMISVHRFNVVDVINNKSFILDGVPQKMSKNIFIEYVNIKCTLTFKITYYKKSQNYNDNSSYSENENDSDNSSYIENENDNDSELIKYKKRRREYSGMVSINESEVNLLDIN